MLHCPVPFQEPRPCIPGGGCPRRMRHTRYPGQEISVAAVDRAGRVRRGSCGVGPELFLMRSRSCALARALSGVAHGMFFEPHRLVRVRPTDVLHPTRRVLRCLGVATHPPPSGSSPTRGGARRSRVVPARSRRGWRVLRRGSRSSRDGSRATRDGSWSTSRGSRSTRAGWRSSSVGPRTPRAVLACITRGVGSVTPWYDPLAGCSASDPRSFTSGAPCYASAATCSLSLARCPLARVDCDRTPRQCELTRARCDWTRGHCTLSGARCD